MCLFLTIVYSLHHSCTEALSQCRFGWWSSRTFGLLWMSHPSNNESHYCDQSSNQRVCHLFGKRNCVLVCYLNVLIVHKYSTKIINWVIPLTGGVEETGFIAWVVNPLLTVHGGVGQSSNFIPGGIPVVDISYIRAVYRTPSHLCAFHTVMHNHRPSFIG